MNRCPITYDECGDAQYSKRGLRKLSPRLTALADLPYTAEEQRREAAIRAARISIQGMQPKLSARLNVARQRFELVNQGGRFILKPQNPPYPELPQNEDLTMRLAAAVGIETPLHGLLYCSDRSLSYFIQRFDRTGRSAKRAVEDFAQLAGRNRETKYDYSIEQLVGVLDHCTFPMVQRAELFKRLLFSFLTGNEDMHLKNHSLIRRADRIELAPAYDYVNTTIVYQAMGRPLQEIEETALPLQGRKKRLGKKVWTRYLAQERMELLPKVVEGILDRFSAALPTWRARVHDSFLSDPAKALYLQLIANRAEHLQLQP